MQMGIKRSPKISAVLLAPTTDSTEGFPQISWVARHGKNNVMSAWIVGMKYILWPKIKISNVILKLPKFDQKLPLASRPPPPANSHHGSAKSMKSMWVRIWPHLPQDPPPLFDMQPQTLHRPHGYYVSYPPLYQTCVHSDHWHCMHAKSKNAQQISRQLSHNWYAAVYSCVL